MGTNEIMKEIQRLPVGRKMLVIERTLKSIRENQIENSMEEGAKNLLNDYRTDRELTAFVGLDFENFYEAV